MGEVVVGQAVFNILKQLQIQESQVMSLVHSYPLDGLEPVIDLQHYSFSSLDETMDRLSSDLDSITLNTRTMVDVLRGAKETQDAH